MNALQRLSFLPPRTVALLVSMFVWSGTARSDSVVVFNEIQYHPLVREAELEWVELHNQNAVDIDLSGWSICDGVYFVVPDGTVIPGGGYVVVAANPAAFSTT